MTAGAVGIGRSGWWLVGHRDSKDRNNDEGGKEQYQMGM